MTVLHPRLRLLDAGAITSRCGLAEDDAQGGTSYQFFDTDTERDTAAQHRSDALYRRENKAMTVLTLDDLIAAALDAKAKSPLGGGTVVHLCEREREYIAFTKALLESDEDGAVFLLCLDIC